MIDTSRRRREEITPEIVVPETAVQEETVQDLIEEEIVAHKSEEENDPELAIDIDQTAQEIITETLQEIVQEAAQKKKMYRPENQSLIGSPMQKI